MKNADNNLSLIGMPACGKSTVGVILAKSMGWDFLDTDLLMQRESGQRLCELMAARGLEGFLALEERTIAALETRRTVIATGGSAVLEPQGMARLHALGTVVYLRLPLDEIVRRAGDITTRGVALPPGGTLADEYRRRTPLYEAQADVTVDAAGRTVEQTVADILRAL